MTCPLHPERTESPCGKCGAAMVRSALDAARAAIPHRTPIHTHPEPPTADLTEARARIDSQEQP